MGSAGKLEYMPPGEHEAGRRPSPEPRPRKGPCCFALAVLGVACTGAISLCPAPRRDEAAPDGVVGLAGDAPARKGSFLVLGDWGWDARWHGNVGSVQCQKAIAEAMDRKMRELGDVQFVINVGDSFYLGGVKSKADPQWDTKWRDVYSGRLRSVPWYSVYGNHDYWWDPCACGSGAHECAQVSSNTSDRSFFYMPNYTWSLERPDLGLEILALDLNRYSRGWDRSKPPHPEDCKRTPCEETCVWNLNARTDESFRLFWQRKAASDAPNLVVFSHYPTDYFWAAPEFLAALKDNTRHIEYFGGHRHNVDQTSTASIAPNNNWLVGGGGGWACDGNEQGFVVGEIGMDFKITTYPVLVEPSACCPPKV